MGLNHPKTIPLPLIPWKNCLPRNQSLVSKRLGPLLHKSVLVKDLKVIPKLE